VIEIELGTFISGTELLQKKVLRKCIAIDHHG
jgi:hypothetical protein